MKRMFPILALAAATLVGCEKPPKMPLNIARGAVHLDGAPAAEARIVFYPETPLSDRDADYPRAVTLDDGTFHVMTYRDGDGLPAGRYQVSIDMKPLTEGLQRGVDPLAGKYRDPKTSGISVDVVPGPNAFATWELSSPKKTK